jgi:biopolymer transport protein ExbD
MLPLIDVVFLLLVFFIYAMLSMVVHHGLKVDLPSAGSAVLDRNDYIEITIDAENRVYIDGDPAEMNELSGRVIELLNGQSRPVFINGDRAADLGLAIRLLDILKEMGIEEVSFSCNTQAP